MKKEQREMLISQAMGTVQGKKSLAHSFAMIEGGEDSPNPCWKCGHADSLNKCNTVVNKDDCWHPSGTAAIKDEQNP